MEKGDSVIFTKQCGACRASKPLDQFSTKAAAADGREGMCRACLNTRKREHYTPLPYMGPKILALLAQHATPQPIETLRTIAPEIQARAYYSALGSMIRRGHVVRSYVDGDAHFAVGTPPGRVRKQRAPRPKAAPVPKPRKVGSVVRLIQNKEARQRDHDVRRAEDVGRAQAPPKVESVADFLAKGGRIQRLRNGDVSPASRFQRLQVRA